MRTQWLVPFVIVLGFAGCGQLVVPAGSPPDAVADADDTTTDTAGTDASVDAPEPDATDHDVNPVDVVQGNECETNYDCNDKVLGKTPCTLPVCDNGYCKKKLKAVGETCVDDAQGPVSECRKLACDDVGQCVQRDRDEATPCGFGACGNRCTAGQCVAASDADYEDGNPCTKDFCNQGKEVVHKPITDVTGSCDDANPCTVADVCTSGVCKGQAADCSDGVDCTLDACDPQLGCTHAAKNEQCDDGNPCTTQTCDAAQGCVVQGFQAGAACDDGSTCTEGDKCGPDGQCVGSSTCSCQTDVECAAQSDNKCLGDLKCVAKKCEADPVLAVKCDTANDNACMTSQCDKGTGQCVPTAVNDGAACDDNNACSTGSKCGQGQCGGGAPLPCDDGNACTADTCDPQLGCQFTPMAAACNDGNACTQADACDKGGCVGVAKACDDGVACTLDGCDAKTGQCTTTANAQSCSDGNPCTVDTCDLLKGCLQTPDDKAACDDGEACTKDSCSGGKCVSINECQCQPATGAKDCDDNNPCTVDSCDVATKKCKNEAAAANGKACDTANKCQNPGSGVCQAGACTGGTAKDCSASANACNTGACDAATGACTSVPKADATPCDADGSGCTVNDGCKAGKCQPGDAPDCSAQNDVCNTGSCGSTGVATYQCGKSPKPQGTSCEDGQYCTLNDACSANGTCVGGLAKTCAEVADACNVGQCDDGADQCKKVPKAAATLCDDGQFCTVGDMCDGKGTCAGTTQSCPGGNCLVGQCDEQNDKCTTAAAAPGTSCSDGNACTSSEACNANGLCGGGQVKTCNGDQCNDPTCDSNTGACGLNPKAGGSSCSDGNDCTSGDQCLSGACKSGSYTCACTVANQAKDCNDGNACTLDACVLAGTIYKCQNTVQINAACSDGNACTQSDTCNIAGACVGGAAKVCNGDQCNDATCDTVTGNCGTKPKATGTTCNDGLFCTENEVCDSNGKCGGGSAKVCPAAPTCQQAACDNASASCKNSALVKGTACTDANDCTSGEVCDGSGVCSGASPVADFSVCSDGKLATSGDVCVNAACVGFSMMDGTPGPVVGLAYQSKFKGSWAAVMAPKPVANPAASQEYVITTLAANGKVVDGTTVIPSTLLHASDQVVVGLKGAVWMWMPALNSWSTSNPLVAGLNTAGMGSLDWRTVGSRLVGTTLYVHLAGPTAVARCYGPDSGAVKFTCAGTSVSSLQFPIAATVSTYKTLCLPPCMSSTTAVYNVAVATKPVLSTGSPSIVDWVWDTSTGAYAKTSAGVYATSAETFGDALVYDQGMFLSDDTSRWLIGPSGFLAFQKGNAATFYSANSIVSAYAIRSVTTYNGYVFLWGSRTIKGVIEPVVLIHKDTIGTQLDPATWTVRVLATPNFNGAYCTNSAFTAVAADARSGGALFVGNVCTNTSAISPPLLRSVTYALPLP